MGLIEVSEDLKHEKRAYLTLIQTQNQIKQMRRVDSHIPDYVPDSSPNENEEDDLVFIEDEEESVQGNDNWCLVEDLKKK